MGYKKILANAVSCGRECDVYEHLNDIDVNTHLKKDGSTALHIACMCGNSNMVTFLLVNEANPFVKDYNGQTPLQIAIDCGGDGMYDTYTDCANLLSLSMKHPGWSMSELETNLFRCAKTNY